MIRKMKMQDLDCIMEIWLHANLQAHSFINSSYWIEQAGEVRNMVSQAEVYVAQEGEEIQGFIGIEGDTIAGIFVEEPYRGGGAGHQLIAAVKEKHAILYLQVYKKNKRAVSFYEREGFTAVDEQTDLATNEIEWTMQWESPEKKIKNK